MDFAFVVISKKNQMFWVFFFIFLSFSKYSNKNPEERYCRGFFSEKYTNWFCFLDMLKLLCVPAKGVCALYTCDQPPCTIHLTQCKRKTRVCQKRHLYNLTIIMYTKIRRIIKKIKKKVWKCGVFDRKLFFNKIWYMKSWYSSIFFASK